MTGQLVRFASARTQTTPMRSIERRRDRGRLLRHAAWCFAILSLSSPRAEQWYVEPRASLQGSYDDNVRLTSDEPISSAAAKLEAEVESGRRTEDSEIGIGAKVLSTQYTDASDLDETDGSLTWSSAYQLGRSRFKLDGTFDYDSTLTSEVATSGYVQVNKRRERVLLSPSWRYALSPRMQLDTSVSFEDVFYEDVKLLPLFDYADATTGVTLTYSLSERVQAIARASYNRYDASQVDTQSDTYGIEAGASYLLSESSSVSFLAGLRRASAETPTLFGTVESDNTGPLFELKVTKQFDVAKFNLTADRSLLPSSNGTLLDTTGLAMSLDYPLGAEWKVSFGVDGYRNRSPDGDVSSYDRDYVSFTPRLEHRLSESLYIDLSYRYRWQKYDSWRDDAISNAVFLGLQYVLPREPLKKWSLLE